MAQSRKVALVTGASTGIGRAAAVALAAAGFDVIINYCRSEQAARTTAEQAQAKGAKTLLFKCNVSDDPCVRKMMQAATEQFGRLDHHAILAEPAQGRLLLDPRFLDGVKRFLGVGF